MNEVIKNILEEEKENIINLRRELHKIPELSNEEYKTAEYIEKHLVSFGYTPERIIGTGVMAYFDCGASETVLMRADIDALPVTETKESEYKSQHEGVMHACGHDAHAAILLCTAKVLKKHKDLFRKNVLLVFQPAEETDGGAERMIKEGIIEKYNVTSALGYHVMNDVPVGKVMIKGGALMASPDDFEIKIKGCGGHSSVPEKCVDPLCVAAAVIPEINNLTDEKIKDGEKQVIHICTVHGGTAYNVIPDDCVLSGSARMFSEEVREKIPVLIEKIINNESEKLGAFAQLKYNFQYPPLINDAHLAKEIKEITEKNLGDIVISWEEGIMSGEDFSYFAKAVPSVFMFLGTGNEAENITMPLHNEEFEIDEAGLSVGLGINMAYLIK